jgi:hypothetical protein
MSVEDIWEYELLSKSLFDYVLRDQFFFSMVTSIVHYISRTEVTLASINMNENWFSE